MIKSKSKLLKKFENNEIKDLYLYTGGDRVGTGAPADPATGAPCTKDSAELSATPVPGQAEGTTMRDFNDYKNEC